MINSDLDNIITPINVKVLDHYLKLSGYCRKESQFLVDGFANGFDMHYEGPIDRQDTARNLPLKVGSIDEIWEKMISETKLGRYAGPFKEVPFKEFVQSPIGLVPKAGSNKTRLIFHLSYDFKNGNRSINHHTPKNLCTVSYNDVDHAVIHSFKRRLEAARIDNVPEVQVVIFYSKTDLRSAYRVMPLQPGNFRWFLMSAINPKTKERFYFVEKCLPFGASISCSHFQRFSNALKHIVEFISGEQGAVTNYLDDFLFIAPGPTPEKCNRLVRIFMRICNEINILVALEKTEYANTEMVFLGVLLDGARFRLTLPEEKRVRAINWLKVVIDKKKIKLKELEKLTGYLNFLNRVIIPSRAFTRRMYAKFSGLSDKLKPHHHVKVDQELKNDCRTWINFLTTDKLVVTRSYIDLSAPCISALNLNFTSDASANGELGFGAMFDQQWTFSQWEPGFVKKYNPSIEFLELFALLVGVFVWIDRLSNLRVIIYCDNEAVVHMVNNSSSSCKFCMVLLRKLTLKSLLHNTRIFARHIKGSRNIFSDLLSRLQINKFKKIAKEQNCEISEFPEVLPGELWPLSKLWEENCANLV